MKNDITAMEKISNLCYHAMSNEWRMDGGVISNVFNQNPTKQNNYCLNSFTLNLFTDWLSRQRALQKYSAL